MGKSVDEILRKYSGQISSQISSDESFGDVSREYVSFKEEMVPRLSMYERLARAFSFVKLRISRKDRDKVQRYLDVAHLDIEPEHVSTFAFFGSFFVFIIGLVISLILFFYQNNFTSRNGLFLFLVFVSSLFVFYYIYNCAYFFLSLILTISAAVFTKKVTIKSKSAARNRTL